MDDGLGLSDPVVSACQQNFAILFTDGYWNGNDPNSAIGDSDGDGISLTLADVADYYYHKDLSSFPNQVPTSVLDENNIQHMVTMGGAFRVKGDLIDTNNDHQPDPQLAGNGNWGNPFRADSGKIDDVWHAAFNSSGIFMAAQNPAELVESIADALAGIADRVGSSASLATNSASVNSSSNLFQSRFDSAHWSGQLLSLTINIDSTF